MRVPFFIALIALVLLAPAELALAETAEEVAARRAQLERELAALEQEIASQQVFLQDKQRERVSLERDVAILDAQIEKARLSIRARDLTIQKLTSDIGSKTDHIVALDEKIQREKQSLAEILRKTNAIDDHTIVEFLLTAKGVSDFFADLDAFAAVKFALRESFVEIEDTKAVTADERSALEVRRTDEQALRTIQVLERQKIEEQEREKQTILRVTKGQEAAYQNYISSREKSAAEIRAELFTLRDSAAIPFGEALALANFASQKTGVRPALILGVLKQETRLGEFLGTGNYITDMHPTRDIPVFLKIAEVLGLDPSRMPVSKQPSYGWGGAMGPAQFIPSTWACFGGFVNVSNGKCGAVNGSYAGPWEYRASNDKIRALIGKNSPGNPWENRDAFMASALLLKDNGAARGTYEAERLAALRYFAGWANAEKPAYAFYGEGVMGFATEFQVLIDKLGGS
jgi:membrane-bound lytic murein transglycosylase B